MSHRRSAVVLGLLAFGIACNDATGPTRDFDSGRYPHIVSTQGVRHFGTSRLLVIPARFYDGAPVPLSTAELQIQLFGGSAGGPVNRAFALASDGAFTLKGLVTSWVQTTVPSSLSGPGVFGPTLRDDYLIEALSSVEDEVDFGVFDNDGPDGLPNSGDDDGVVDGGVAVLNSELNRYCNGGTGKGPHPFAALQWRMNGQRYKTGDASANGGVIEVGGYTLMSAIGCGGQTAGAHVLAHELGHLLFGLPDSYHPLGGPGEVWATRRWVAGCWDLMAAGSWGCGTGAPTLDYRFNTLGAWPRSLLGWVTPVHVDPSQSREYELLPMGRGGTVLRVPVASDDEYLLIEYRVAQPGDDKVPGNGVVMYHVAQNQPIFPANLQSAYRMSLIEADDDSSMFKTELQGGNRGTASDAFGLSRNALRTNEHSRTRAVDGSPFPFHITDITIDGAARRARLRIGPGLVPNAVASRTPGPAR
ncbi:MAG TPA: immune inhibitor A domain-containing protein [Gemmatimonadaceae bacterium]